MAVGLCFGTAFRMSLVSALGSVTLVVATLPIFARLLRAGGWPERPWRLALLGWLLSFPALAGVAFTTVFECDLGDSIGEGGLLLDLILPPALILGLVSLVLSWKSRTSRMAFLGLAHLWALTAPWLWWQPARDTALLGRARCFEYQLRTEASLWERGAVLLSVTFIAALPIPALIAVARRVWPTTAQLDRVLGSAALMVIVGATFVMAAMARPNGAAEEKEWGEGEIVHPLRQQPLMPARDTSSPATNETDGSGVPCAPVAGPRYEAEGRFAGATIGDHFHLLFVVDELPGVSGVNARLIRKADSGSGYTIDFGQGELPSEIARIGVDVQKVVDHGTRVLGEKRQRRFQWRLEPARHAEGDLGLERCAPIPRLLGVED